MNAFDRPMRWHQLTLSENDPGQFDPDWWLDYFRRTHTQGVSFSAGGCVAFYPTEIPLHRRSAWLGDSDPFGYLVRGCREMGMTVLGRTDPHASWPEMCDAHPDWISVDVEGNPRPHGSMPGMWLNCVIGPYAFTFMTEIHREIMRMYAVDGIFSNRWAIMDICYCIHCDRGFREATGHELPRARDIDNPAYRAFFDWREQRLFALYRHWDAAVREINPDARFIPNSGGGATSMLDMKYLGENAPLLFADRQNRTGVIPPWENAKNAKEFRSTLGRKPAVANFNVGLEDYRWKDSFQSEPELRIWLAEAIANGMRLRNSKFSGTLRDRRWVPVVEDVYNWHHRCEKYLRNDETLARVAIVYSQQTARWYGPGRMRNGVVDPELGMHHALIEARIPFEMVHDQLLDPEHVDRYRLLLLPNIACLSDAQCDQIRGFVARGGSIVATRETSLYDETGRRRDDFGLADLFGVRAGGEMQGPILNSYLRLERYDGEPPHPLLDGLEDVERTINGAFRIPVEPRETFANPPLTLSPSYPDLPMEQVFPREDHTGIPEVFLREVDAGRVAYVPWDIDRIFWEVLHRDHGILLRNLFRWGLNEDPIVTVEGPGVLDVTVWRQRESITVHLVNLTNPMMMKPPFREIFPIGGQRVRVRLPEHAHVGGVRLLVADEQPPYEIRDGLFEVNVPAIAVHEAIAIDLDQE